MRLFILLTLLLILDLYAFQAFRMMTESWHSSLQLAVFVFYWSIPLAVLVMLGGSYFFDLPAWNKNFYSTLRAILLIAYVSKFIIVVPLLVDDVRRVGMGAYEWLAGTQEYDYSRSRFLAQLGVLLGGIPFITLTYGIVRNPYRYKLFRQVLTLDNLPAALEGLRIVQISDIHSGSFTLKDPVRNAVDMVNAQQPDLVFFTGDLVNYRAEEIEPFLDVFDKVQARYGVYSVLGNHDYGDYVNWEHPQQKAANLDRLKDNHHRLGWDLLLNENRQLTINGEKIAVIGVENYSAHPRFPKHGDLALAHKGTEGATLKLLLSHDPSHWREQITTDFQDIDITFSGHTHGMQFGVEIPGWIKWSPIKYVYEQWAGLYQQGRQYLYVNRGLGFHGYPGRVGILPEVTLIELRSGLDEGMKG